MSQNKKIFKKIGAEFLMGIFGALGTHVETKVGLGVFFINCRFRNFIESKNSRHRLFFTMLGWSNINFDDINFIYLEG